MLNIFAKKIDPDKILGLQNFQYQEKLVLSDEVPANSQKMNSVNVSSLGDFYCLYMTGHFSTLKLTAESPTDNGVVYLRGKLIDGSNQRALYNDYIPFDLWLSPGRKMDIHSTSLATDHIGETLFYPQPFQYMFTVNSEIMLDVKNDSDAINYYDIVFHGVRFPVSRRANKQ